MKPKDLETIVEELEEMLDRQGIKSHYLDEEGSNQIWHEQHDFIRQACKEYAAHVIEEGRPEKCKDDCKDHEDVNCPERVAFRMWNNGISTYEQNMRDIISKE